MSEFNVLLVDDHPLVTEGISSLLLDEKFAKVLGRTPNIESVNSVEQATDLLDTNKQFDLIMLDLSMPNLDGFDLLQQIRRRELTVHTIVLSASDHLPDMQRAHDLGANGFIGKFEPAEQLLANISTVVKGNECYPDAFYQYLKDRRNAKRLTPRQLEVLQLIAAGKSNKQISVELEVSEATVKFHVSEIFQLLEVHNRTMCVREAIKQGWIKG